MEVEGLHVQGSITVESTHSHEDGTEEACHTARSYRINDNSFAFRLSIHNPDVKILLITDAAFFKCIALHAASHVRNKHKAARIIFTYCCTVVRSVGALPLYHADIPPIFRRTRRLYMRRVSYHTAV